MDQSVGKKDPVFENLACYREFEALALNGHLLEKRQAELDAKVQAELEEAGIPAHNFGFQMKGEVRTQVFGTLYGWKFERAWYYWSAEGCGIPVEDAEQLHARLGNEVRVAGHCGCPSPREWYGGFGVGDYHVDTQRGLNALAALIREIGGRGGNLQENGSRQRKG